MENSGTQLSDEFNCTEPAIEKFPQDLFTNTQLEHGAIIVHILATVYLFTAIAIICDQYFVPAVEKICSILHVPNDIGGATFMAVATACPELFVNVVGTFVTEGDIGLGTIVGSTIFNILAVPACGGLTLALTKTQLKVDWWPLTRDSVIYGISVCLLIIFLNNEKIEWYEAVVLVLLYLLYIVFLFFDKNIQKFVKEKLCKSSSDDINEKQKNAEKTDIEKSVNSQETKDNSSDSEEFTWSWKWPQEKSTIEKLIWLINWPINCVFALTVPNCEKVKSNKWVPVAFVNCIVWIGILSYILSWMITVAGDTFGIPDSVMGISFLAIGSGVPEAASSIVVIKKGQGNMGIANSLGSNTFNVLICLGLPWMLKTTVASSQNWVNINSSGMQYSTILLLVSLIAFYLALLLNKFKLNKWVGLYTMIIYVLCIGIASAIELNVFFPVNLPTCKH